MEEKIRTLSQITSLTRYRIPIPLRAVALLGENALCSSEHIFSHVAVNSHLSVCLETTQIGRRFWRISPKGLKVVVRARKDAADE